ncbi:MAG: response regulator [Cyclobacteriaceae bacterium]
MINPKEITILYVDDEEANLFLFDVNFGSRYPVFTASSGGEALSVLEANSDEIIVVISDMKMPGMNGIEFIKEARNKYSNIVYFILTGYASNDEIEDALENKIIYQWFTKPFNMKEVEEAIQNALMELQ